MRCGWEVWDGRGYYDCLCLGCLWKQILPTFWLVLLLRYIISRGHGAGSSLGSLSFFPSWSTYTLDCATRICAILLSVGRLCPRTLSRSLLILFRLNYSFFISSSWGQTFCLSSSSPSSWTLCQSRQTDWSVFSSFGSWYKDSSRRSLPHRFKWIFQVFSFHSRVFRART